MAPKEDTPLLDMLTLGLEKHLEALTEISTQASKEFALEKVKMTSLNYFKIKIDNFEYIE